MVHNTNKERHYYQSLQGLRGLASLSVFFLHLTLAAPNIFYSGEFYTRFFIFFLRSPLGIICNGTSSVAIFFVLSGYVLVQGMNSFPAGIWLRARICRLYIPVIAVVAMTSLVTFQKRNPSHVFGDYLRGQSGSFGVLDFLNNSFLLDGTSNSNGSLWTMRLEVIFSLAVPIIVSLKFFAYSSMRQFARVISALAVLLTIFSVLDNGMSPIRIFFIYFLGGSALYLLPVIKTYADIRIVISLLLIYTFPYLSLIFKFYATPFRVIAFLAIVMLVEALRSNESLFASLLANRFFSTLGKYSFSLYLVHSPIIALLFYSLPTVHSPQNFILNFGITSISVCFATFFFFKFVEAPSHRYSKKILTSQGISSP